MRIRNVKKAYDRIDNFDAIVQEPEQYKGEWHQLFGNHNPIYIEIGMGKGKFLLEHARRNPTINYIGFEKFTAVLVKALDRLSQDGEGLSNIRVVRLDAEQILDLFEANEVDRIYLNFSDPWPKERHYKRRLTYRDFLNKYRLVMKEDGWITFKTDNSPLFEFTQKEMEEVGMSLTKLTRDLHSSQWAKDNVMTEYETKFHSQGLPIHMLEAKF